MRRRIKLELVLAASRALLGPMVRRGVDDPLKINTMNTRLGRRTLLQIRYNYYLIFEAG